MGPDPFALIRMQQLYSVCKALISFSRGVSGFERDVFQSSNGNRTTHTEKKRVYIFSNLRYVCLQRYFTDTVRIAAAAAAAAVGIDLLTSLFDRQRNKNSLSSLDRGRVEGGSILVCCCCPF